MPWVSHFRWGAWLAVAWGLCAAGADLGGPNLPVLATDSSQYLRLQRTLMLLSRSSTETRNPVRILFFGQPFESAGWWTNLVDHLRGIYPDADIVAENRCLNLHYSEQLVRFAETEVITFRPDLVVLQCSGNHYETQRLVGLIRERTSADVLLMSVPLRGTDRPDEPTDPAVIVPDKRKPQPKPEHWNAYVNHVWYGGVAEEFGVAFADIRRAWKSYLVENSVPNTRLIPDGVHYSAEAENLIFDLLKPWFNAPGWMPIQDPWDNPRVSTYRVPQDVSWVGRRLKLEFNGNRVDAILAGLAGGGCQIMLDGVPIRDHPQLTSHGKCSNLPGSRIPALLRVGNVAPLVDEKWVARVFDISTNGAVVKFRFEVRGTKTGEDGQGSSEFEFLSRSHRVRIEPQDWNIGFAAKRFSAKLPDSFEVTWETQFRGVHDLPSKEGAADPRGTVPLAFGLDGGRHTLELIANSEAPARIQALRVYRPSRPVEKPRKR